MKNSKNAILRYGFQIMILIAAGFLTGGGCKDAAPVDCGALSVSDCPADKCATYTNRLTKVQFCEKKIDATGTECTDLSDKICDAENVITGKECGYLPKTVGSPDKECFELQDNCLVIGNKEALCKAAGITKAGQSCEWDTTAVACKNPAIDFCNEVRDINDCNATLVAGRAPNGCYRKTNVGAPDECTERHTDCTGLPAALFTADPAIVARAVVNAPDGCFQPIGSPTLANIVSGNCAAAAAAGYVGALCTTPGNNTDAQQCYVNTSGPAHVCEAKPGNCNLADADCNSNNTLHLAGCYPMDGGGCGIRPNRCEGLDGADCDEANTTANAACYVESITNDCATKPADCMGIAEGADCKAANVTSDTAQIAGCLWGVPRGSLVMPLCYQRVKLDPGQVAGDKCASIGDNQRRCLVPGIEVDENGVNPRNCQWDVPNNTCVAP